MNVTNYYNIDLVTMVDYLLTINRQAIISPTAASYHMRLR
jgi:hypothetical protein